MPSKLCFQLIVISVSSVLGISLACHGIGALEKETRLSARPIQECTPIGFARHVEYDVGETPSSIAVSDLDTNGKQDLVVANLDGDSISILAGNGDGTFQSAASYPVGPGPYSVAVGDFNADSRPDVAVANIRNHGYGIAIFLGNGDASMQDAVYYSTGGYSYSVAVGDFNDDGNQDLVTANRYDGKISILLGAGEGGFTGAVQYNAGQFPESVAVGDFNQDSKQDLAVANFIFSPHLPTDNVAVLLGNGDGTFQAANFYTVGSELMGIVIGDFDANGKQDLAVVNSPGQDVFVLLGNGDGTFQALDDYSQVGTFPASIAVINFDPITQQDLAVANVDGTVSLLPGIGNGTFQPHVFYDAGSGPVFVAVGNFDNSSPEDLAVANSLSNNISILTGTCITNKLLVPAILR